PHEIEQNERMFGLPKVHVAPTRPARRRTAATATAPECDHTDDAPIVPSYILIGIIGTDRQTSSLRLVDDPSIYSRCHPKNRPAGRHKTSTERAPRQRVSTWST